MNFLSISNPLPPDIILRDLDPEAAALWRLPRQVPLLKRDAESDSETTAEAIAQGVRRLLKAQPGHADAEIYRRFLKKHDRHLWDDLEAALSRNDWRAAIRPLELMLAIDPEDARAHCDLATAYRRTSKFDLAEKCYREAIALAPELAAAQTGLGGLLFEIEKTDEAIAMLEHSLKVKADQPGAHYYLGRAYGSLGDDEQASVQLRRASDLLPRDPRPRVYLAVALSRTGDLPGALAAVDSALAIDPMQEDARLLKEALLEDQ